LTFKNKGSGKNLQFTVHLKVNFRPKSKARTKYPNGLSIKKGIASTIWIAAHIIKRKIVFEIPTPSSNITSNPGANNITFIFTDTAKLNKIDPINLKKSTTTYKSHNIYIKFKIIH